MHGISLPILTSVMSNAELFSAIQKTVSSKNRIRLTLKDSYPPYNHTKGAYIGDVWKVWSHGIAEIALSSTGEAYARRPDLHRGLVNELEGTAVDIYVDEKTSTGYAYLVRPGNKN